MRDAASCLAAVVVALCVQVRGAEEYFDETKAVSIFAFDGVSIPFTQNLRLEMRQPERHASNPVLKQGPPGSPDALGVQFYGSIIRENGKYRLWYVAYDDDKENKVASSRWRPAYAESTDGINWTKPNLGLVTYKGNKENNLIRADPTPLGFVNLKVLADPEDADPQRRYKITGHVYFRHNTRLGTLAPFTSADGLDWKLVKEVKTKRAEMQEKDLFIPPVHFEPSGGLYKWDGIYYAIGQSAMNTPRPHQGRVTRMYHSADFVNWSPMQSIGFVRAPQQQWLGPGRSLEGEQTHEGISVWNRRNLLLGVVGLWHGAKEWKDITVDLGFVMSNDGLNFREPAHEWVFLKRGEEGTWDQGGVLQGQGFENIGDQTFIYYGSWDPRQKQPDSKRGGVGIAVVPRDRFGELVVETIGKGPGDYQVPEITSEFVTASVPLSKEKTHQLYLNAHGLGDDAMLHVQLLDHLERPVPGFSGKDAAVIRQSGFQTPVIWKNGKVALPGAKLPERMRVHVTFKGAKNTDIRFAALYLRGADGQ